MKNELTAIIINFMRREYLMACVKSLRETYPDINIIVGNNDEPDAELEKYCGQYGAEFMQLPFDSGVCGGRNGLMKHVKTPYVMIGDDDFFYTPEAGVDRMLELVKMGKADLVGGRVREAGKLRNYQGFIRQYPGYFVYEALEVSGEDIQLCDITFNYFVARTEAVREVLWDENIKVAYEHSTFFIDFKRKGYTVGFTPQAIVEHKNQVHINTKEAGERMRRYRFYRNRKNDKAYFYRKYNLQYCIDMAGRRDSCELVNNPVDDVAFCITMFERPEHLRQLLLSIAKYYPSARIYIADQSKKFILEDYQALWAEVMKAGLKNKPTAYNMPFDCGLSRCRNGLIDRTEQPYILMLEEDFVFNDKTRIEKLLKIMEAEPEAGIVGGLVLENETPVHFEHVLRQDGATLYHDPDGDFWQNFMQSRYKRTGSVMNFALFKREVFRDISWDERIKIEGEHTDFYWRLSKTPWAVFFTDSAAIEHDKKRGKFADDDKFLFYRGMRQRKEFMARMMLKHHINKIVYLDGFTMELGEDLQIVLSHMPRNL